MWVFDAYANDYSFWTERINPPRYDEMLNSFLPEDINLALDAGCGPGHLSFYLAERAKQVIGADLSSAMIDVARARRALKGSKNVDFLVTDLNHIPLEPGTLDFVGSDCVLHDTPLDVTLPALSGLLKPGGRMVVRDLVTSRPSKSQSWVWQLFWTLKRIPRYMKHFGLPDTMRLISFEVNPAWLRQRCKSESMTPDVFRATYSRSLPGSKFKDYGWAMAAFWEAPTVS